MTKEDYIEESKKNLEYYYALTSESELLSDESTDIVRRMIDNKEKGEPYDMQDFVELSVKSYKGNTVNSEILMTITRIKLLYRLALNDGVDLVKELPERLSKIVSSVCLSNNASPEYMFVKNGERMDYASKEMADIIANAMIDRTKNEDLEVLYNSYKAQYDNFLKMKENYNHATEANVK